jgi:hypothetical protein
MSIAPLVRIRIQCKRFDGDLEPWHLGLVEQYDEAITKIGLVRPP